MPGNMVCQQAIISNAVPIFPKQKARPEHSERAIVCHPFVPGYRRANRRAVSSRYSMGSRSGRAQMSPRTSYPMSPHMLFK